MVVERRCYLCVGDHAPNNLHPHTDCWCLTCFPLPEEVRATMSDGNRDADDSGMACCGGLRSHAPSCPTRTKLQAKFDALATRAERNGVTQLVGGNTGESCAHAMWPTADDLNNKRAVSARGLFDAARWAVETLPKLRALLTSGADCRCGNIDPERLAALLPKEE